MSSFFDITTKQFGDAYEYAVLSELNFAGLPSTKLPNCWPGYNLMIADRPDGRVSVRGLRHSATSQRSNGFWRFKPEGWDWLALVRFHTDVRRQFYVVPCDFALANSRHGSDGCCDLNVHTPGLEAFRDNWTLSTTGRTN